MMIVIESEPCWASLGVVGVGLNHLTQLTLTERREPHSGSIGLARGEKLGRQRRQRRVVLPNA